MSRTMRGTMRVGAVAAMSEVPYCSRAVLQPASPQGRSCGLFFRHIRGGHPWNRVGGRTSPFGATLLRQRLRASCGHGIHRDEGRVEATPEAAGAIDGGRMKNACAGRAGLQGGD